MEKKKIKVLIVDDSRVMQESIAHMLRSDPVFEIVGFASNGQEAIDRSVKYQPDVITMDWEMPVVNGYDATKRIMETNPTPIVVVTGSITANDVSISFSLMEAGALAVLKKPHAVNHPAFESEKAELIESIKLMSEIKLVRRITRKPKSIKSTSENGKDANEGYKVIAIGASTGGPIAIQTLLTNLSNEINMPIVIVQHISVGFVNGFAEWLMNTTNFPVHIAFDGEVALPGHVYVAPDNYHLGIDKRLMLFLSKSDCENGSKPAVSFLFRSCINNIGENTIAVLLSGMGRDGSDELKKLKDVGALTYAQDEKSSVVHGMPGEAIKLNAARYVCTPMDIGRSIVIKTKRKI